MNQLPELNKIYQEDCLSFMKKLPDKSINLVVTSPPYNIGISYSNYDDNKDFSEYTNFCIDVYKELYRVIQNNGVCAIVVGNQRQSGIPFYHYFWLKKAGHNVMMTINWYKGCYYIQSEFIFICGEKKDYKRRYTERDGFYSNGGWSPIWMLNFPKGESQAKLQHQAFFVSTLPAKLMEINTEEGDIVFDPFMGSGSTAVAAKRMKRNFLGCEISSEYIAFANERVKNTTVEPYVWKKDKTPKKSKHDITIMDEKVLAKYAEQGKMYVGPKGGLIEIREKTLNGPVIAGRVIFPDELIELPDDYILMEVK